jgi:RNA-binding protein
MKAFERSETESLKRLGKVLHLSRSRSLVVKLESETRIRLGIKVYDSRLREVGFVADIFGPVTTPYIAIRPIIPNPVSQVGRVLYSSEA